MLYRRVPTLQEILLVDSQQYYAEVHRRGQNHFWATHLFYPGDSIELISLSMIFPLEAAYEKESLPKHLTRSKFMEMSNIAKYLYEIGHLKRVKRSGWWMAGIVDPESVAEHSYRTAVLGYVLASLEGADPMKTATICLFHDTGEARIGDLHRVAKRYIDVGEREEAALSEQVEQLPRDI